MITQDDVLQQIPIFIFWKDLKKRFMGGNLPFIQSAGLKNNAELNGKYDDDLPWAIKSDEYRRWDNEVICGYHLENHREIHIQHGNRTVEVLVNKKPLYNNKQTIIGLIGCFSIIAQHETPLQKQINNLPKQQKKCLNLLVRGLSTKQIAQHMKLTPRTIEYYIAILKKKFDCRTQAQLIIKAIP